MRDSLKFMGCILPFVVFMAVFHYATWRPDTQGYKPSWDYNVWGDTYYVDGDAGSDAYAGTAWGSAKKTITAGVALMTSAKDSCLVKNSVTYTEGDIEFPNTNITDCVLRGDDGAGNPAMVTIDATGYNQCIEIGEGGDRWFLAYFEIENASQEGVMHHNASFGTEGGVGYKLSIHDNGTHGWGITSYVTQSYTLIDCKFYSNGSYGATINVGCIYYRCSAYLNGSQGFGTGQAAYLGHRAIIGCSSYDNVGRGIYYSHSNTQTSLILGNTIHSNDDDNIEIANGGTVILGNIITNSKQWGLNESGASPDVRLDDYNNYFGNADGTSNAGLGLGPNSITTDPAYTDSAASADLQPKSTSPVRNIALPVLAFDGEQDLGAYDAADSVAAGASGGGGDRQFKRVIFDANIGR